MNLENVSVKLSPIFVAEIEETADAFGVSRNELIRSFLPSKAVQRVIFEQTRLSGAFPRRPSPAIDELLKKGLIASIQSSSFPVDDTPLQASDVEAVAAFWLRWSEACAHAMGLKNLDGSVPRYMLAPFQPGGDFEARGLVGKYCVLPAGQGYGLTPDNVVRVTDGVAEVIPACMV